MIHIKPSKDGQFYFTVTARNGNVLVTSETYKRKQSCYKAITSLVKILGKATKIIDGKKWKYIAP